MYHYVRPTDRAQPHLHYLNLDDFRRQLDFFERSFGFVSHSQWQSAIEDPHTIPNGVILTFDDGLMDHYEHVWPELKARGLWGVFYVSSATLSAMKMLNVHRIHYLLGRFGGAKVLSVLEPLLCDSFFIDNFFTRLKTTPYSMQSMDEHSLRVKKIVNYSLKPEYKDSILSDVFEQLAGEESAIAQRLYMNNDQIREMADDGFTFGAHGGTHNLLTKFTEAELNHEVTGSIQTINELLTQPSETFCFPYGGPDSWNDHVLKRLRQENIMYSFCVEPADITVADLKQRPLLLPRYDCNEFPFGKSMNSK